MKREDGKRQTGSHFAFLHSGIQISDFAVANRYFHQYDTAPDPSTTLAWLVPVAGPRILGGGRTGRQFAAGFSSGDSDITTYQAPPLDSVSATMPASAC